MANKNAVIGLLRVLLSANTAEFESAMKRSADSAKAWSKDLKSIGTQATQVGTALTKTLTLPIAAVGISAAKLAIDFESSFAGVRKTVEGTEPQLAELAQGFRNLSKTIPVNVNDLNRLGEAAGALGIPRDKIVEFAAVMAKLGVSTNLTADQAADAIARIQNIFGAAGKDTERLASTLVALGNAGASTEKEIVEMGQRIAGAGHTVGLTQAQVLAFASTLASVGINAEAGGSAISRVFLKINDAVQKGGAGLAEFARVAGMSSAQFKQSFETDAAKATQAFIEGLGRLKSQGENINSTIEGLTGKNIILKDTLFRLSGAGKLLSEQLQVADGAWKSNTALSKEAGERFKTTESQMTLLGNRVKDVGITLGNALGPAIGLTIRGLNTLIPVLEKIAGMFAALPAGLQLAIVGFAGLVAAAGPAIYIFGQLSLSASAIVAAFGKTGTATLAMTGFRNALLGVTTAAGGIILPLTGLAAAIVGTQLATGDWWETLKVLTVPLYGTIRLIEDLIGGLIPAEGVLRDVASIVQDALVIGFRQLSWALGVFMDGLKLIPSAIGAVVGALRDQLHAEITRLVELLGQALPGSLRIVLAGMAALPGALGSTKRAIHDAAEAMDRLANRTAPAAKTSWKGLTDLLTGGFVPAQAAATAGTHRNTGATNDNNDAKAKAVALTSQQVQVLALLDKAHAHQAAALDMETAAWKQWEQTVSKALSNIATNPVLLQGRNLSGLVPQVGAAAATGGNLAGSPLAGPAAAIGETLAAAMGKALQQLPQMLIGAFQGGGNVKGAVQGMGTLLGSTLGKSIGAGFKALGKFGGPIGEAIGSLAGPLAGMFIDKFFGTAGRDIVKDFAAKFGGFDALHVELNALGADGERLWIALTQGVGRNNPEQAKAAVDAITKALAAQKDKTDEAAQAAVDASKVQQEALDAITAKYADTIAKIDSEYKSLSESVAQEAEEDVMGIVEMQQRARMKELEDQKRALEAERDAELASKQATFDETLKAAQHLDVELRGVFERGYKSPLSFELPPGWPTAAGAIPSVSSLSAGTESSLTAGSRVLSAGAAQRADTGMTTLNVMLDGKVLSTSVFRHLPGILAVRGVGGR